MPLAQRIEAQLQQAVPGARFGLVVATEDSKEILAIAPEQRFVPASNTKLFTTAVAFAALSGLEAPDAEGGAAVRLDGRDVVLEGRGDARLSSAADCRTDCLAELADAVAARTRSVRNVVGDDSLFPDERWSPGMSWNNIPTPSGTGASALTVDDNELVLTVTPRRVGETPTIDGFAYFTIENRAITVASGETTLDFQRMPGSRAVRVTGTIAAGSKKHELRLGIDDPAHYAAWRLKGLLEARGLRVTGEVQVRHRPLSGFDDPSRRGTVAARLPQRPASLARLIPPPLAEDIAAINKVSQNLHSDLLLRRVGLRIGTGSIADGIAFVTSMLAKAGLARAHFDFADGSGMSTYNRVAPRGVVRFLGWTQAQAWGAAWRATLPIAGVDGTLDDRFKGTPLEGRLFAKTGTLNATSALSGFLVAKSGRTLIFSAFANDVPAGMSAVPALDAALIRIAAEN
ncbi:MAG TPA: D-alanyl-D-alanine carboxypeptidase/D-alanyl-D-alanine-endopeptidase [Allosphingosinicella sp.]|nr:D-alanyl-D-alanine carboxypeptidase/D-alanyl-D-alanine-endopeptidase [Allosphingosinicella sp.]